MFHNFTTWSMRCQVEVSIKSKWDKLVKCHISREHYVFIIHRFLDTRTPILLCATVSQIKVQISSFLFTEYQRQQVTRLCSFSISNIQYFAVVSQVLMDFFVFSFQPLFTISITVFSLSHELQFTHVLHYFRTRTNHLRT